MKTVLGFLGSPRKGGNSKVLLEQFLSNPEEKDVTVEIINLNELNFKPCQSCGGCERTGQCIVKDDLQEIFKKIATASGIVIATPIYFASMSGQTKAFIDRFQGWWNAKYLLKMPFVNKEEGKLAFLLTVGAIKNSVYHENATQIAKMFFSVLNYNFEGALSYMGYDAAGSIKDNTELLKEVEARGKFYLEKLA